MMVLPKEKNLFIGFENDDITFVGVIEMSSHSYI